MKPRPERMTYAQQKLMALIDERKLRRWCEENGFNHSFVFNLAFGNRAPTYKNMASMCQFISPIEWLFSCDEKLPYEPVLLPPWKCDKPSKFVLAHRYDYKTLAQKYGLSDYSAYKIFVSYTVKPSPAFIRKVCAEANPIDFFTEGEGEIAPLREFVPDRGDLVSVSGKTVFVITKKEFNKRSKSFSGCLVTTDSAKGIKLKGVVKGVVNAGRLFSFPIIYTEVRSLIEKAPEDLTDKVMEEVRKTLE